MPTIAVTIVDQTVAVTQVGEIGPTGPTGTVSAAGDGTAAAPSIAFASDTDTGIFRAGTNILAASTGGTERVRVDSSGNVGIGTTSPGSYRLNIQAGSAAENILVQSSDATAYNAGSVQTNNRLTLFGGNGTGSANLIRFSTGGSNEGYFGTVQAADGTGSFVWKTYNGSSYGERMRMLANGNVGIGTIAPDAALSIFKSITYSNSDTYPQLIVGNVAGATGKRLNIGYDDTADVGMIQAQNRGVANTNLSLQRYGGNVGIGTSSPGSMLDISGAGGVRFTAGGTYSEPAINAGVLSYDSAGGDLTLSARSSSGNTNMLFRTSNSGTGTEKMRIRYDGNVGIGMSNPLQKLVVNGNILVSVGGDSGVTGSMTLQGFPGSPVSGRLTYGTDGTGWQFRIAKNTAGTIADQLIVNDSGHITPGADNTQNFGSGSLRWATIFAGTGTINTSDERYKVLREGGDLSDAEHRAWSAVRAIVYRDKDSFERKGDAARLHIGYSWQSIQAAFEAEGLDPARYGLWCEDALEAPVEKTRTATRPVEGQTETVPVLDDDGQPVFEQVQETEEVEQPFEEVRIIDGAPVLVKGVRTVAQPVFDSVQIRDEDGELVFDTPQPVEDPETGELVEGDPIPRMAPVPRMISRAKTETVPVMEEYQQTYTEMEPTGETRGALRYSQCSVIEAAWLRRELASLTARVSALEAV